MEQTREHINNALIRALKDACCIPYGFKEDGIISSEVIRALDDFYGSLSERGPEQITPVLYVVRDLLLINGEEWAQGIKTTGSSIDNIVRAAFRRIFEIYDREDEGQMEDDGVHQIS